MKNSGLITQAEALAFLGMHQNTFKKYADRLNVQGERIGRCTLYKRSDIERMSTALGGRVPLLISALEQLTGGKVSITF